LFLSSEPSKGPPIWRIIDASHSPASWTVHLMWKVKQHEKLQELSML